MRIVSFKVDEDLFYLLEMAARRERVSKSELVRRALKKYLLEDPNKRRVIVTRKIKVYL